MHNRSSFKLLLVLALLFALLSACNSEGEALSLTDYPNPNGLYTLQIPKNWSADYDKDASVLKLTPPGAKGAKGALQVFILVVPITHPDPDARLTMIKSYFQPFLEGLIDEDQEITNRGETTVDHMNAILLDFGKPWQNSYMTGREVLVSSSNYAIAFVGLGEDQAWQTFLPTFRQILTSFHLTYPEPTPLPGGFKP
jgi:hypothetical protein